MAIDTPQSGGEERDGLSRHSQLQAKEAAVDAAFQNPDNIIIPVDLDKEMKQSFITYAMSVITDRALPDIRDGLKPVHRRILYSMFTQGFTPDKPYRKCATTVGDVLGRFHPHGDASVYDALVRLAQDFSMRHTLVDGHGNFGSRDGDPPAAYRYTEARLTKLAQDMMADINKDTVDFQPNFDEHAMEPNVLPAPFPNLLVNGSSGIAVGMATNIPAHNLGECIDATLYLIDYPEATIDDLMEIIPGPDFPTYGTIMGLSGIRKAYKTGRGSIVVRANCEIVETKINRHRIIVHDLPYMVNKARLIERIASLVKDKRIEGISDVRDESDRNEEIRIVIELKRDATPNVVLNQLYKSTQLQDNFSANMLALVPDETGLLVPKLFTLKDALLAYLDFYREIVVRRTKFDLEKAEARKHIVAGLQMAIDHIDEVINIIRASANENAAREALRERFGFSEKQAQHVVDMRLGRLSGLEREKLESEYQQLEEKIEEFQGIISDGAKRDTVINTELLEAKRKYAEPRRTSISPDYTDIDDESLIEEEDVVFTLSEAGYVKRVPTDTYEAQRRGGRGIQGMNTRDEDLVKTLFTASSKQWLLAFSTLGKVYRLKGYQIPEASRQSRGTNFVNILQLTPEEKIYGLLPMPEDAEDPDKPYFLVMATRKGLIKKTRLQEYANIHKGGIIAMRLQTDDSVIAVDLTQSDHDIFLATKKGLGIRFHESCVRATGRATMGVRGIRLGPDDEVVSMLVADDDVLMTSVTEKGLGKRTPLQSFRSQYRCGKGLIAHKLTDRTGDVVRVIKGPDEVDLLLMNADGLVIRVHAAEVPILGRNTQGVKLMRAREAFITDVTVTDRNDDEVSERPESLAEAEAADPGSTQEDLAADALEEAQEDQNLSCDLDPVDPDEIMN